MRSFQWDRLVLAVAVAVIAISQTQAQNTINGRLDAWDNMNLTDGFYGQALSVQNTDTGFGNTNAGGGDPDTIYPENLGNEIDQVFARVDGDRLHVFVAGNLSTDFTKLNFFFDSEPGQGVNVLDGDDLPFGIDPFCCGGLEAEGALQRMNGLAFDTGFDADHFLLVTAGTETGKLNPPINFWALSAHYADLTEGAAGRTSGLGFQLAPNGVPRTLRENAPLGTDNLSDNPFVPNPVFDGPTTDYVSTDPLPGLDQGGLIDMEYVFANGGVADGDNTGAGAIAPELPFALDVDPNDSDNSFSHRRFSNIVDLRTAFDNSNVEGVDGYGGVAGVETMGNPEEVTTGVEFSIPLSEIGADMSDGGGEIKLLVFLNGQVHDFASNQFSGLGVLQENLEGFGFLDAPPGDYDNDGRIGASDLGLVLTAWGTDNYGMDWVNEVPDGTSVGAEQLGVVLTNWGGAAPSRIDLSTIDGAQFVTIPLGGMAVPEPTTGLLVVLGLAALAMRRR